jgi:hypothetical protein
MHGYLISRWMCKLPSHNLVVLFCTLYDITINSYDHTAISHAPTTNNYTLSHNSMLPPTDSPIPINTLASTNTPTPLRGEPTYTFTSIPTLTHFGGGLPRIEFVSDRDDDQAIYTFTIDDTNWRKITNEVEDLRNTIWSLKGTPIANISNIQLLTINLNDL